MLLPVRYIKDPLEIFPVTRSFSSWLGSDDLADLDFPNPPAVLLDNPAATIVEDDKAAKFWVGGGTLDQLYSVTVRGITAAGNQKDETIEILVRRDHIRIVKDPDDEIPRAVEWSDWLNGATIVSSDWQADAGLTLSSQGGSGTVRQVNLSGGVELEEYELLNIVTASDGRTGVMPYMVFMRHN